MEDRDFLRELSYEGISSRIKRLSDTLLYGTKEFYKEIGIDIEPNWYLVFRLLQEYRQLSIKEVAARMQFSHPASIKIIRNMQEKGYLEVATDPADSRKQLISLSAKARKAMPELEKYWAAGLATMKEVLEDNPEFSAMLAKLEDKVQEIGFKERALRNLKKTQRKK
ncbi:MarR family winged helix-turn-helix transcriptional regulator [Chitinophaga sp. Cy-1792]|uniref:MarR family winged helix-turn-helix transcriptional regulator n=1 Tax=Chitinophaga sp. Cy-1792 TaxID=2608339 RepID=UPI00141EB6F9|nr:helix-turn-helix domain-containing protein [Chitinophaga sp. Cy-1792]NIG56409.1 MarR family transcriptional regulator [Chitinophaga sp. Cy-1792]